MYEVIRNSAYKLDLYNEYRKSVGEVHLLRTAYFIRSKFTSAVQADFSDEARKYQLFSYYDLLSKFNDCIEKDNDGTLITALGVTNEDIQTLQQRFTEATKMIKDSEVLDDIKEKAYLAVPHAGCKPEMRRVVKPIKSSQSVSKPEMKPVQDNARKQNSKQTANQEQFPQLQSSKPFYKNNMNWAKLSAPSYSKQKPSSQPLNPEPVEKKEEPQKEDCLNRFGIERRVSKKEKKEKKRKEKESNQQIQSGSKLSVGFF